MVFQYKLFNDKNILIYNRILKLYEIIFKYINICTSVKYIFNMS